MHQVLQSTNSLNQRSTVNIFLQIDTLIAVFPQINFSLYIVYDIRCAPCEGQKNNIHTIHLPKKTFIQLPRNFFPCKCRNEHGISTYKRSTPKVALY